MADISQTLLPLTTIFMLVFNFISAMILPIIQFLFGLGEVMFAKMFIVCILTIILYKAAVKIVKSSTPAFIVALIVSLLGIKIIPDSVFSGMMAGWYVFALLGVFIAFTLLFRTVWWQRRTIMFLLIIIFAAFWYFYQKDSKYIIIAIVLMIFLIFDSPIHRILAPLREIGEKREEIKAQIALKEKEINDMLASGTDEKSSAIANRRQEIKELIGEESKL